VPASILILANAHASEDDFSMNSGPGKGESPLDIARFSGQWLRRRSRLLLGRLVGLPEAYWDAIAISVVMQSPLARRCRSGRADRRQRAGSIGRAIESTCFGANLFVFAPRMLLSG